MIAVEDLIPHRPPMQLIDSALAWSDDRLWASVNIVDSSPFLEQRGVHTTIGLEYLAQASAAFFSVLGDQNKSADPKPGMLVASRQFTAHRSWFELGSQLLVLVKLESPLRTGLSAGLVKFSGDISRLKSRISSPISVSELLALQGSETIVQAELSVYL